ncbi:hypothetical protein ACFL6G_09905 [candidate division KSB1 bacterium]
MNKETTFGKGIVKTSARPIAIFVDSNNNEYVCDKDCIDNLDASRPFEEQSCSSCESNPFDIGG